MLPLVGKPLSVQYMSPPGREGPKEIERPAAPMSAGEMRVELATRVFGWAVSRGGGGGGGKP